MAEGNGSGRLDRLEALLDKMGERLNRSLLSKTAITKNLPATTSNS
jgi:hypothetical protein